MPLFRATSACAVMALCLSSTAALSQEVVGFDRADYGKVVLAQRQFAGNSGDAVTEINIGAYNNEPITSYGARTAFATLGKAVGRLDVLTDKGVFPCTAFIVSGQHIVTNNHCVPGILDDERVGATEIQAVQFVAGYVLEGVDEGTRSYQVISTPVETNRDLDYTVLEVIGDPSAEWGSLPLDPRPLEAKEPYWVIGHPMGESQRISREKCRAADPAVSGGKLRHTCDTLPGNSGSPIIDVSSQRVVALHHAGSKRNSINYAIPMSSIIAASSVLSAIDTPAPEEVAAARIAELTELVGALNGQLTEVRKDADNTSDASEARIAELSKALDAALAQLDAEQTRLKGAVSTNDAQTRIVNQMQGQLAGMTGQIEAMEKQLSEFRETKEKLKREERLRLGYQALSGALALPDAAARLGALAQVAEEFAETPVAATASAAITTLEARLADKPDAAAVLSAARERCQAQAASPFDPARPAGSVPLAIDKIDTRVALALCRAPEAEVGGSAATSFALGRALEAAGNYAEARTAYLVAQKGGYVAATTALGRFERDGLVGGADIDRAILLFEKAAEQGDPAAMTLLADIYTVSGGAVLRDFASARGYLERAAELGYPHAIRVMARAYKDGTLYDKDPAKALDLFRQAGAAGDPVAQFQEAMMVWRGIDGLLEADVPRALELLEEAARNGSHSAQDKLGNTYLSGMNSAFAGADVPRDFVTAKRWLAQAAEDGFIQAQMQLAQIFADGKHGVEKDPEEALRWFDLAAQQDYVQALAEVARRYEQGIGVDQDPVKAADYWMRTLELGALMARQRSDEYERETALEVQRRLKAAGFYAGPLDGDFGPGTDRAMKNYTAARFNPRSGPRQSAEDRQANASWLCQC